MTWMHKLEQPLQTEGAAAQHRLQHMLAELEQPALTVGEAESLGGFLSLLMQWNSKMNLTSIRDEGEIIRQHLVDSIFCARMLPAGASTLLDYGSGGGFPGVPCAICRPEIRVTLAESHGKKVSFLREAVRRLDLKTEVYYGRAEAMPLSRHFDVVTLRAVDHMRLAVKHALPRVAPGGWLVLFATSSSLELLIDGIRGFMWSSQLRVPGKDQAVLLIGKKAFS